MNTYGYIALGNTHNLDDMGKDRWLGPSQPLFIILADPWRQPQTFTLTS